MHSVVRSDGMTWCSKCGLYSGNDSHFERAIQRFNCAKFNRAKGTHEWEANGKTGHRRTYILVNEARVLWTWIGYSCVKCKSSGYLDVLKHDGRLIMRVMTMDRLDSCSTMRMRRALG